MEYEITQDATLPTTGPQQKWHEDRFTRLMIVIAPFVTVGFYFLLGG
jgi:hypothetical protein